MPFYSWDWLYYFWNRTGLLSNMLNVKRKETLGKYGKTITENALLEQRKHKAGLGEVSPPNISKTQTVESRGRKLTTPANHRLHFPIYNGKGERVK